jgi:ribA/ribD-fused uncharacterized protein
VTLFSGELCPLSNLHSVIFEVDGKSYASNEHFYQINKCQDHGEQELVQDIIDEPSSRQAMLIGKKVKPNDVWLATKGKEIMRQGINAKFEKEEMKKFLLKTTGTLGEATRHQFWGIGHNLHTDGHKNISNWSGNNNLGKLLTELRDRIKAKN